MPVQTDHQISHFNEVVAYEYRPGFIPFGADDTVLSVSTPIIKLVGDIPARALMAWDKRLLARTQHLTLLIIGLRGTYPVLQGDGTLPSDAAMRGILPQFRIGLTPLYKPHKEDVAAAVRVFGLKVSEQVEVPKEDTVELTDEEELEELDSPPGIAHVRSRASAAKRKPRQIGLKRTRCWEQEKVRVTGAVSVHHATRCVAKQSWYAKAGKRRY